VADDVGTFYWNGQPVSWFYNGQPVNFAGQGFVQGAPPEPPGPTINYVYQGARIDGPYYGASYAFTRPQAYNSSTPTLDSPQDIPASLDVTNTTTGLYEAHQGKKIAAVHWGPGVAWPPNTMNNTTAQRLIDHGAFSYFGFGSTQVGTNLVAGTTGTATTGQPTGQGPPAATTITEMRRFFTSLKTHNRPILFRPWWEMQGTWYPWGRPSFDASGNFVRGLTDAQYIQLWRNTWQICADVMSGTTTYGSGTNTGNVSFHWAPNNFNAAANYGVSPEPRWPGAAYVDWTGWQGYHFFNYGNTYTPEFLFGDPYRLSQKLMPGSPIAVGEYGCLQDTVYTGGKAKWFDDWFDWLERPDRERVKCIMYYNEYEAGSDYETVHIEYPETARARFAARLANPRYLAGGTFDVALWPSGPVPVP
jgi:hypothetical protein